MIFEYKGGAHQSGAPGSTNGADDDGNWTDDDGAQKSSALTRLTITEQPRGCRVLAELHEQHRFSEYADRRAATRLQSISRAARVAKGFEG